MGARGQVPPNPAAGAGTKGGGAPPAPSGPYMGRGDFQRQAGMIPSGPAAAPPPGAKGGANPPPVRGAPATSWQLDRPGTKGGAAPPQPGAKGGMNPPRPNDFNPGMPANFNPLVPEEEGVAVQRPAFTSGVAQQGRFRPEMQIMQANRLRNRARMV